jgi:hypothetical protein
MTGVNASLSDIDSEHLALSLRAEDDAQIKRQSQWRRGDLSLGGAWSTLSADGKRQAAITTCLASPSIPIHRNFRTNLTYSFAARCSAETSGRCSSITALIDILPHFKLCPFQFEHPFVAAFPKGIQILPFPENILDVDRVEPIEPRMGSNRNSAQGSPCTLARVDSCAALRP